MNTTDATEADRNRFLRRFRLKSFLPLGTSLLALVLFPLLIGLSTHWSYGQAFDTTFMGFLALAFSINLGKLILVKPRAKVLLDAGPYPQQGWLIFITLAFLLAPVLNLDFSQTMLSFIKSQAFNLLLAAFFTLLLFSRLQVYQKGIWLYNGLLPWRRIKAYRWQNGTLYFETKGIYFWTQTSCVVPEAHVKAFEAYLLEHGVPDTTDSVATA